MPQIGELPLWLRAVLLAYPWRRIDPVPVAPMRKPLSECRVALVTTAGLVPPGERAFDDQARGGDVSYRLIGDDAELARVEEHHRSRRCRAAGAGVTVLPPGGRPGPG